MSIEQTFDLNETSRTESTTRPSIHIIRFDELARIRAEARRLQVETLGRMIGRLFAGKRRAAPKPDDATEEALRYERNAEMIRKIGNRAARVLGGRAITGPMSNHMLNDIGLTRARAAELGLTDLDLYKSSGGSKAA